jgi:arylsulfatase A-like enzyme
MPSRPNILVFMTDQQQADVVHPDHPCRTPNASRLTEEGVQLTQLHCPTAHCCPTRATFMTGLYPSRHGVQNNVANPVALRRGLLPGVRMFSEDLREAGYELQYTGKWHVSDEEDPGDRGWTELMVTCGKGSFHHQSWERWEDPPGMWPPPDERRRRGQVLRPGWGHYQLYGAQPDGGPKGYEGLYDYRIVQSGIEALRGLAATDQPWMLYIGVNGPHDPFIVPERFATMYDPADVPLPPSFADTMEDKPRTYQRMRNMYWGQLSKDEVRESIAHYWGYCTMLDEMFGEVLQALEAMGRAADTLVIFTSDHGDYAGAHGLYCKGVPAFREAYNVPLIVRWPKGLAGPGRLQEEFVSTADFAPTFLELAGCAVPPDLTGRSILPFLRGDVPTDWRDEIQYQLNGVELYYSQRTIRTKDWRYSYNGFDFDELYDLTRDPHETVNLADPRRYPQPLLHVGETATSGAYRPWPHLPPDLEAVRDDLMRRIWRFNRAENDVLCNPYATVALAPRGPADALAGPQGPR